MRCGLPAPGLEGGAGPDAWNVCGRCMRARVSRASVYVVCPYTHQRMPDCSWGNMMQMEMRGSDGRRQLVVHSRRHRAEKKVYDCWLLAVRWSATSVRAPCGYTSLSREVPVVEPVYMAMSCPWPKTSETIMPS